MSVVYIRTDANENIATGHIMRCITIARQIELLGEDVIFIIMDTHSAHMLEGCFTYIMIPLEECDNNVKEANYICKLMEKTSITSKILLDLYKIDAEYMSRLNKVAKVITFDDLFSEKYPASMIINYNLYYSIFDYEKRYKDSNSKLLLGGEYVPLRQEFEDKLGIVRKQVTNVMIISGGADKLHVLHSIIKIICKSELYTIYRFHVVVGGLNKDLHLIKNMAAEKDIEVYHNISNIAEIMSKMDVVISAAGTVLYECCKMGIPTIFFCMVDNQKFDQVFFSENKIMFYAGDIREEREKVIDKIFCFLDKLAKDYSLRMEMHKKMVAVIDGNGSKRIAREIIDL